MKRTTLIRSLMSSSRNRSWNRGPHVLPNPKKRSKIRVRDPESAKLSNQPTRKMTTRLRWRHLDPDVCAKFDEERYSTLATKINPRNQVQMVVKMTTNLILTVATSLTKSTERLQDPHQTLTTTLTMMKMGTHCR